MIGQIQKTLVQQRLLFALCFRLSFFHFKCKIRPYYDYLKSWLSYDSVSVNANSHTQYDFVLVNIKDGVVSFDETKSFGNSDATSFNWIRPC